MTDKKPAKKQRRGVSKPRLLKAIWQVMEDNNLDSQAPIGDLEQAIKDSMIADAIKEA